MSEKLVKRYVRDPMSFDTHLYDKGIDCSVEPSMTKQEFAEECDINTIMRRYETTGRIDHVNSRMPEYGDFASVPDYQSAVNTVLEAESMFAELPARMRDRFGNNPQRLLEFLADPENRKEAEELGLVQPAPPPPPPPEPNPPAGGSEAPAGASA